MNRKTLESILAALGILTTIYGLYKSEQYPVIIGIVVLTIIIIFGERTFELFKYKQKLKEAKISIEGRSITALNLANIERLNDKNFKVKNVKHTAVIENKNASFSFEYSGICIKKPEENGFLFSVEAENNVSFNNLDCYGYDLLADPQKMKKLRPIIKNNDGISKKVLLPFATQMSRYHPFSIFLTANYKNCMSYGKNYYNSTLSFNKRHKIESFKMVLKFKNFPPKDIRVYEIKKGNARYIRSINPETSDNNLFIDQYKNVPGIKQLVYIFDRK